MKEHSSTNNITITSQYNMAMPVTDWERRALIISLQASEAKLTAENKKITDHRDRLLKKMRRQAKEIETMKHNEGLWMKESFSKDNLKQRIGWLEMRWNDVTKERDDLKKENESLKENQKSFPCSATLVVASID
tara:strand:- start:121 stop:522 length:402 start_codon:yes stop_codon:yes gene_type:complete